MKNYVQQGATLTAAAPYDVVSGAGALIGRLFGVASGDALSGVDVELVTEGVFDLKKLLAQAWTVGAKIYWDNTAKKCTTVVTANTLIGLAVLVAANPSATGRVKLTQS
ncbi:MAG: hypothetical protein COB49_00525 [Alphaproteobacteria bacterium]|nr:MAG: hypothetical protein COB49_00525 [Alphaproteobacteria bacterium]